MKFLSSDGVSVLWTRIKSKFLAKDNSVEFTPTEDFHPATKKYVDDKTASAGVGQKTDGGGEIFNDYEGNIAHTPYSSAKGTGNTAGATGYHILSAGKRTISTDSNLSDEEKYRVVFEVDDADLDLKATAAYIAGDKINFEGGTHLAEVASITSLYTSEDSGNSIIETTYFSNYALDGKGDETEDWLSVTGKAGGEPVLQYFSASVEGEGGLASGRSSHVEGRGSAAIGNYGHAEGRQTTASYAAHSEGYKSRAIGNYSHAEGQNTEATGQYSHTEGFYSKAEGYAAHAEGNAAKALGKGAHAEGDNTTAEGFASHTEGSGTKALNGADHAEGSGTIAEGGASHAEGQGSRAKGKYSHAEGQGSSTGETLSDGTAGRVGKYAHAEGYYTEAWADAAHAEGYQTDAYGLYSHSEGWLSEATQESSHAEGFKTHATGIRAHAEGNETTAEGKFSHSEGDHSTAKGIASHVEGYGTVGVADYTHAEGYGSIAGKKVTETNTSTGETTERIVGANSHAEGNNVYVYGENSHGEGAFNTIYEGANGTHAEGCYNEVYGKKVHAEGEDNTVSAPLSHVEGYHNTVSGSVNNGLSERTINHVEGYNNQTTDTSYECHVEGNSNTVSGYRSHVEGYNNTVAENAHAAHVEGVGNNAYRSEVHIQGKYSLNDEAKNYIHIVGNGTSDAVRSNAHTLDAGGNAWFAGNVTVGDNKKLATEEYVDEHMGEGTGGDSVFVATYNETPVTDIVAAVINGRQVEVIVPGGYTSQNGPVDVRMHVSEISGIDDTMTSIEDCSYCTIGFVTVLDGFMQGMSPAYVMTKVAIYEGNGDGYWENGLSHEASLLGGSGGSITSGSLTFNGENASLNIENEAVACVQSTGLLAVESGGSLEVVNGATFTYDDGSSDTTVATRGYVDSVVSGGGSSNIFVAQYGVTPWEEVNQAYLDGKALFMYMHSHAEEAKICPIYNVLNLNETQTRFSLFFYEFNTSGAYEEVIGIPSADFTIYSCTPTGNNNGWGTSSQETFVKYTGYYILNASNNSRWKLSVSNSGELITECIHEA